MTITAAQAMVRCLQEEGIRVVFGLPGAAICPFYDALSKTDIRHILVRQEQNAGHAASGYARLTKRPAVCIATSGPGALNLITAVATAYMDSIPLVVITGQVSSELLGRDVFQEADITGSCEPFVKHSYLVKNAADIPRIMKEAFHIAGTGRQGPVLIDVPSDVQTQKIPFTYPEAVHIRSYKPNLIGHPGQIKRVVSALSNAKRPLICAGGGVFSADACEALLAFSQKTGIPVVTTMMGLSCIPANYPLNLGMIGMHGAPEANRAMNSADVLLLIGARVGDRAIMSPMGLCRNAKIIHIDIDPAEIGKNIETDIPLVGSAKLILEELYERADKLHAENWSLDLQGRRAFTGESWSGVIRPKRVIQTLCKRAEEDAVLVADVGQNQIWSARGFSIPHGRFLTSGGMGTMGYSIPAAIGAKLAAPGRQVIADCGDGSFQMQMMELATIRSNSIPVKMIVMNNSRLGMVRELQDTRYGGNETAVFLDGNPDFVKLAESYGIPSCRISNDGDIDEAIQNTLSCADAYLLECTVSPEEPTL
mgnify:FL=1